MPWSLHCQIATPITERKPHTDIHINARGQMRRIESCAQARTIPSVHGQVHNLFRLDRYFLKAVSFVSDVSFTTVFYIDTRGVHLLNRYSVISA